MHILIPGEDTEISCRKALSAPSNLSFSGVLASRMPGLEAVHREPNSQMAGNLCSSSRVKISVLEILCAQHRLLRSFNFTALLQE